MSKSAFLPLLTMDTLLSILFSLKCNKSPGIDGIRIIDLRRNISHIQYVLLTIVNEILDTGAIPNDLKTALVKPIFKGGAPEKKRVLSPNLHLALHWRNFRKASLYCDVRLY